LVSGIFLFAVARKNASRGSAARHRHNDASSRLSPARLHDAASNFFGQVLFRPKFPALLVKPCAKIAPRDEITGFA